MVLRLALFLIIGFAASSTPAADAVQFEMPALPAFQRYTELLEHPGYIGVALQNAGLITSQSSKAELGRQGRSVRVKNTEVRYVGKKGSVYNYEAAYLTGVASAELVFPIAIDTASLAAGKIGVSVKLPLSALIPKDFSERIKTKAQVLGNTAGQEKVLKYLETASTQPDLAEAILLDAYNRSGGVLTVQARDVGDAVPLSDQWMLLLTLFIWLIVVPLILVIRRIRQARARPA
jgi:hypothetical protein